LNAGHGVAVVHSIAPHKERIKGWEKKKQYARIAQNGICAVN